MTASVSPLVLPASVTDQVLWAQVLNNRCAQRLVETLAVQYARCGVLEEEDLRQAGQIGLLEAARRFDPGQRVHFCTYARWWVRAEMASAMEWEGRNVRFPTSAVEARRRIHQHRAERGWSEVLDAAQRAELAVVLGVNQQRVQRLLDLDAWSWHESVEERSEEGEGVVLSDEEGLAEEGIVAALDHPHNLADLQAALEVLAVECPRDRDIVAAYHGLEPGAPSQTYRQIAARVGLSRERVRQLEQRGLRRLRELMDVTGEVECTC